MKHGLGLCGAHRVGKTTLAEAIGTAADLPFVKTQTSQVFHNRGVDPARPMPFDLRLSVQKDILSAAIMVWEQAADRFVTDRTPLDMAAYTLADIQGSTEVDSGLLARYLTDCIDATNQFFSTLIIVPPGIPLVSEPGKAALHLGYIEHIHTLVVGLCFDRRVAVHTDQLPRETLSLQDRIRTSVSFLRRSDHPAASRP